MDKLLLDEMIEDIKREVIIATSSPSFVHNKWYLKYHLEIVERIALELCDVYQSADKNLILILVWLHDYNKIFNIPDEDEKRDGVVLMRSLGFSDEIIVKTKSYINIIDSRTDIDFAPLEVKIVSSADGASHFIGPFFYFWWYENFEISPSKLMKDNYEKALRDWNKKIVLPEVRNSFRNRFELVLEQCGKFPDKYIDG